VTPKSTIDTPSRLRAVPWTALLLTLGLGVSALMPAGAVRDAASLGPLADARLERSLGYAALGPDSSMCEEMTLFYGKHIFGVTVWAMVLNIVSR
jgi:hypothetical protein